MYQNPHLAYELAKTLVDDMHRDAFRGGSTMSRAQRTSPSRGPAPRSRRFRSNSERSSPAQMVCPSARDLSDCT
jgi:hypothetical protein